MRQGLSCRWTVINRASCDEDSRYDVWNCLFRHVVQLRRHYSRRYLGRSILGRFWGWDPKENGALLIVIWNAIILHARWDGYARERGIALLAVFGNIITSLSWFGMNMLGVGLHSYGFTIRRPESRCLILQLLNS